MKIFTLGEQHFSRGCWRKFMQVEARPRATGFVNGAIIALRGMNLNPRHDDEDMVSLRAWVTENTFVTVRCQKLLAVDDI